MSPDSFYELEFSVTAKIEVNGEAKITSTWKSSENFDDCYRKIENWVKKNSTEKDQIVKHILATHFGRYLKTKFDAF